MEQQEFNDKVTKVLDQITEALVSGGETRDALYQMIQLDSSRVDSLEDRIDILMSERGEHKAGSDFDIDNSERFFDILKKRANFETSIDEHVEREEDTITPKALLDLGFIERYQEAECGEPGFMYYDFRAHGIDVASNEVGENPLHVYTEDSYEIHSLRKLKNLITSLNEL